MRSLWSDSDAEAIVARYGESGVGSDLALRVYTSRLLGGEPRLVLHGGGNTSVKTVMRRLLGEPVEVLCVKGSGWDMGEIEPAGPAGGAARAAAQIARPATRCPTRTWCASQRANLLDPGAPNPSVETLLHAFLPHKFIDHTHADCGAEPGRPARRRRARRRPLRAAHRRSCRTSCRASLLAKKAAEVYEGDPAVEGLVLLKHGVFSFGDTAREAYDRMIAIVSLAEERLARGRKIVFAAATLPARAGERGRSRADPARRLRLARSERRPGLCKRFVLDFRGGPAVLDFVNGAELPRYGLAGVATPDHTIRTKNYPLIVPAPEAGRLDEFAAAARDAVERFVAEYHAYFARHNARRDREAQGARPGAARHPGAGARAVRPRAQRQGRRDRRRSRRDAGSRP